MSDEVKSTLPDLTGKSVALVAMGASNGTYLTVRANSMHFDEVWTINVMGAVLPTDRCFMLDPPSRFLDSDVAGGQTEAMRAMLTEKQSFPIYSCITDKRCPSVVDFPLQEVVQKTGHFYLNNTPPYALAFAVATNVKNISLFGLDYAYKNNVYVAEAGRGCVEFWIGILASKGCQVNIAPTSTLLDSNVAPENKLYGYHRLDDPMRLDVSDGVFTISRQSEYVDPPEPKDGFLYSG